MSEETTGSHQPHESEANPRVRNENLLERISIIQSGLHAENILAKEPEQDSLPDATGQMLSRVALQAVAAEGRETRNQLLLENMGLIRRVAGNVWHRNIRQVQDNLEFSDLMQYGAEAMIDSFAKFSLQKAETTTQERLSIGKTVNHETLFATYVGDRVYRSIVQTLADETVIKVPDSVHVHISGVNAFQHELTKKYQRNVSFEEALLAKNWPILDGKEDTLQLYRNRQALVRTGRRMLHVFSLSETINRNDLRPLDPNDTLEAIIKEANPEDLALERFEEHTDNLELLKKIIQLARKNHPVLTERELFVFAQLAVNELRHHEIIDLLAEREGHSVSRQMVSLLNNKALKKLRAAAELLQEPAAEELAKPEEPKLDLEYYRVLRRRTLARRQKSKAEEVIIADVAPEDYTQEPEIALTEVPEPDDAAVDFDQQPEEIVLEESSGELVPNDPATLLHSIAMRFGKGAKEVRETQADILINHFLRNGTMGRQAGQEILTRLQRFYIKSLANRIPRDRQAEAVMVFFLGDDKNKILPMPFTELVEFLGEREHANPEKIPDFVLWVLQQELTWITQQLPTPASSVRRSPQGPRSTKRKVSQRSPKTVFNPELEDEPEPISEIVEVEEQEQLEAKKVNDEEGLDEEAQEAEEAISVTTAESAFLGKAQKNKLLSAEEEVELAKQIEAGLFAQLKLDTILETEENRQYVRDLHQLVREGKTAKNRFVEANLLLCAKTARRFMGRGLDFPDLIQEGNLGLIKAVEKFDYTKGFKFSGYATPWIEQSIRRGIGDKGRDIRIPVYMVENVNKLRRVRIELGRELNRQPTDLEVAAELEITPEKVREWTEISQPIASLNTLVGDGDNELGDLFADTSVDVSATAVDSQEKEALTKALETQLTSIERDTIRLRFGLQDGVARTLDQVAELLGYQREYIRQIQERAIKKLRDPDVVRHFSE